MKKLMLGALVILAGCGPYTLSPAERDTTELGATKYSMALGMKYISCSGQDSDGDKYVTCTIAKPDGSATSAVLCSYEAQGCKPK